ncbi:5137_t:CDS:10 [Paraglomus occultum]|uniref:5137_t:CDS:1 n=1 Tax=Paraglomus occultum TaxID=144539 RepID=A0A9N9BB70_9GLOM|nr:5137_t:CDS:10 [Paraglomus occultum]
MLKSGHDLVEGTVIPESAFRDLAQYYHGHRDGTEFSVDIQMRIVEHADEPLRTLWITYDRSLDTKMTYHGRFKKDDETKTEKAMQTGETLDDEQSSSDDGEKSQWEESFDSQFDSAVTRAKTTRPCASWENVLMELSSWHTIRKIQKSQGFLLTGGYLMSTRKYSVRDTHSPHTPATLSSKYSTREQTITTFKSPRTGMGLFEYIELDASMPETESNRYSDKLPVRRQTFCGNLDYAASELLTGREYDGPPRISGSCYVIRRESIYNIMYTRHFARVTMGCSARVKQRIGYEVKIGGSVIWLTPTLETSLHFLLNLENAGGHWYELFVTTYETDLTAMVQACYIFYQLSNYMLKMQAVESQ